MKTNVFQIRSKFFSRSTQRHGAHRGILILLFAVVLLMGCNDSPNHNDTGFIPVGVWVGPDGYGDPDRYIITNTTITYDDPWGFNNFSSSIITVINFSSNAGVIIVQVLDDPEPDSYTPGNYTCVYFREYTLSNVKLACPLDAEWNYIEVDTLIEALNTFTVDNVGNHVGSWGSYTK